MRTALKYNPDSSAIYLEMAACCGKIRQHRRKRLTMRKRPPNWIRKTPVRIGCSPTFISGRRCGEIPLRRIFKKAVQELEKLRELSPADERVYYALGGAYFELNQPEKAIQAYEKFQSLSTVSTTVTGKSPNITTESAIRKRLPNIFSWG